MASDKEARWGHVSSLFTRLLYFSGQKAQQTSVDMSMEGAVTAKYHGSGLTIECTWSLFPRDGSIAKILVQDNGRVVLETTAIMVNKKYRVVLDNTIYIPGIWEEKIPPLPTPKSNE